MNPPYTLYVVTNENKKPTYSIIVIILNKYNFLISHKITLI